MLFIFKNSINNFNSDIYLFIILVLKLTFCFNLTLYYMKLINYYLTLNISLQSLYMIINIQHFNINKYVIKRHVIIFHHQNKNFLNINKRLVVKATLRGNCPVNVDHATIKNNFLQCKLRTISFSFYATLRYLYTRKFIHIL